MADYEPPITLGLTSKPIPVAPTSDAVLRPEELQFDHAIPLGSPSGEVVSCVACKSAISGQYFQAQGQTVCPACAQKIESGQRAPPAISLMRAVVYGAAAAFAGFLLYAFVAIAFDLQIGFISILVGLWVGKAVRKGSDGRGGRPQQILAVALTYFAITTSYIPVYIYQAIKNPDRTAQSRGAGTGAANPGIQSGSAAGGANTSEPPMSVGSAIATLLALALAAPFLSLTSGLSGILNIVIIFFGLQNAWKHTGRTDLLITGPYGAEPA